MAVIIRLPLMVLGLTLFATNVSAQSIKSIIHSDGSFDIVGTTIKITNAYPALDNRFLKPINVEVTNNGNLQTIKYSLREGMVELQFGMKDRH